MPRFGFQVTPAPNSIWFQQNCVLISVSGVGKAAYMLIRNILCGEYVPPTPIRRAPPISFSANMKTSIPRLNSYLLFLTKRRPREPPEGSIAI
ncbi:MAG: hypothetical protein J6W84_06915, partial [Bacteroidales bacterium]|nr:hypothetical protein [Bacteroidales bacterium]